MKPLIELAAVSGIRLRWASQGHSCPEPEEEMANDGYERKDIESAIFHGFIEKQLTLDVRGTRYRIEGPANDGRLMHVLCRFREMGDLIIITVYERE